MTQQTFADLIGLTRGEVSRIICKRVAPSRGTAALIELHTKGKVKMADCISGDAFGYEGIEKRVVKKKLRRKKAASKPKKKVEKKIVEKKPEIPLSNKYLNLL
jgi:DNA-binding transcriptional regulator YdaS (Cro superfamily)